MGVGASGGVGASVGVGASMGVVGFFFFFTCPAGEGFASVVFLETPLTIFI